MERKQLKGVIRSKIYGISKHQDVIGELKPGEALILKRELNNSFDPQAIQIQSRSGKPLGYVKKELAAELAKELDQKKTVQCKVLQITGEGYSTRGVNVEYMLASFQSADQSQGEVI